ncbi:MAG: hypothetical protein KDH96_07130, partial [Candidatus Riesia sp.]|nr:hypothetical protein [Candidatus Riesia sp.]
IKNTNFCPTYFSIIIKNFNNNIKSDTKVKKLLQDNNINLHNYIVDLTNYMLLITGQPFHAYDLDKINSEIIIQEIEKDQIFYTINNNEINIKKNTPVITDNSNKILALPGLIGSSYAKVDKNTKNILIECAVFEKNKIKELAKEYNIQTNSGNIFECGVDLNITDIAFNYCLKILNKNQNIKLNAYSNKQKNILFKPSILKITKKQITNIIGQEINDITLEEYFKNRLLKFKKYNNYWKIKIPYNRSDINIHSSIISEILKCHGYKKINTKPIKNNLIPYEIQSHYSKNIKQYLIDLNFNEVINYSFVEENIEHILFDRNFLKIENPMSDKMNIMRSSLLQGLLKNVANNTHRHNNEPLNLFELGSVWTNKTDTKLNLGIISTGDFLFPNLYNTEKAFYVIKNIIENICIKILNKKNLDFNTNVNFIKCFNQKISAEIYLDNLNIGTIGLINNSVLHLLNIHKNVYFAEIFLDNIHSKKNTVKFIPFSKLPKIIKDISFILNTSISYKEIFNYINTLEIKNLKTFYLINTYISTQNIKKKTLTFRFIFQNITTTLKDEDVSSEIQNIYNKTISNFDVVIKGFNDNNHN